MNNSHYDVRQVFDITLRPMLENWMRECKFNVQIACNQSNLSLLWSPRCKNGNFFWFYLEWSQP